jgi:hypothetical protein
MVMREGHGRIGILMIREGMAEIMTREGCSGDDDRGSEMFDD